MFIGKLTHMGRGKSLAIQGKFSAPAGGTGVIEGYNTNSDKLFDGMLKTETSGREQALRAGFDFEWTI